MVNMHINILHQPSLSNVSFPSLCLLHMIAVVMKPMDSLDL